MDGEHENSPWQHKTVTFRKLLQHIVDEAGNKVFHAVNRVMLGPDAGSLQVATYRTLGVQQMAKKVKHAAVAWIYHYGTQYCKLTVKCMDKVVIGCDFDEVLLIESTTWDPETISVTFPFFDYEDVFVREMEENSFTLDISAITEPNPDQAPAATGNTQANQEATTANSTPQPPPDPNATTIPSVCTRRQSRLPSWR